MLYASAIADDKQIDSEEVTITLSYSDSLAGEADVQEVKVRVLDSYSEPSYFASWAAIVKFPS